METKFNFNSAICTSREQSERLLALGLKKETADMALAYMTHEVDGTEIQPLYLGPTEWFGVEERRTVLFSRQKFIPSWSLHRLIEMIRDAIISKNGNDDGYMIDVSGDGLYDGMIEGIEILIKGGYFNEEYLNKEE